MIQVSKIHGVQIHVCKDGTITEYTAKVITPHKITMILVDETIYEAGVQRSACPRMGISQHISIFPEAAQIALKSSREVGMVSACSQSRSATPRTSTSQQSGLPVAQSPTCRRVAGMARALAKRPLMAKRVVNEVLILAVVVEGD